MIFILQSCQSQSNFDLTQLTLKGEKINDIVSKDMKPVMYPAGVDKGGVIKKYVNVKGGKANKLLNFNGTSLVGKQSLNSKNGINGISFYYKTKDSTIYKYDVYIFSKKQAKDLLTALKKKLGEPQFTSFSTPEDKINGNFEGLLWVDNTKNHLYMFEYSLDQTIKAKLIVQNNSWNIEEITIFPPFSYWEDYLYDRKRKNDSNFSYQDFLKKELENNPNDIQNKLSK